MNPIVKLLAIVVLIFLAGYFFEEAIDISGAESVEGTLEVISELFSVFVAFSIFAMTWHSYDKSRDNRSLFIGMTFYLVGLLILFHLLSYPFMPEFFTPNSDNKAAIFLIESRIILAVLLLIGVNIHNDTIQELINKRVMIIFMFFLSVIILASAIFYNEESFKVYDLEGYSAATIFFLIITTAPLLYVSYRYFKEFKETGLKTHIFMTYGPIIIIFSNLVYFSYEFSAHFLIITGFYFIYLALYKSSVELPYEKLAIAEEKLRNAAEEKYRNLFNNANDAIIIHDLEGRITSWNHAAEMVFGWTSDEIMGKHLLSMIVPEGSRAQIQRNAFNITRGETSYFEPELLRRDGSRINASLTVSNLIDADQNVIGISCIIRDITEHKRTEEELKLRGRIIETMAEGVYLIRASDGVIVYANPKFEEMFGYDKRELIGKHVSIVNGPAKKNQQDVAADIIKTLKETGEWSGEVYNIRKDCTTFWCYATVSTFNHPEHGNVWISVHTDITERKRAEESLRLSEGRLVTFINSATDAVTIWDSKLTLVDLNNAAAKYLPRGVKRSDVVGKNLLVLEPDAKTSGRSDLFLNVIKTGKPLSFERLALQLNLENVVADRYLNVRAFKVGDGLGLMTTDITERKRMEEALIQSEEKYRTLYESSSDAIMMLDEKGFFDCNNATLQMFGFSEKEDFIKMHPADISPPYQPNGMDSFTEASNKIAQGFSKGTNQFEWVHRRNNGEDFPAEVLLTSFQFGKRQVIQANVRDITERRKAEEERKKAEEIRLENEQLVHANKVKSEFLAIMSHELRTPLNAVIGFSELMNGNAIGELNEKQKRYLENIHTGGKNLLSLVDSILDLSRVEAGKMELFNEKMSVPATIKDTLTLFKEKAVKQKILIKTDLDPQLEVIETDAQKFKHILSNLLDNALKFSKPEGGTVTIRTKKEGDMAVFSVADTGIGIKEENMGKLFRTFEQMDTGRTRKYGGAGLGLAVSKKLVELHGGEMTAESRYGEGSTFTFYLPIKGIK